MSETSRHGTAGRLLPRLGTAALTALLSVALAGVVAPGSAAAAPAAEAVERQDEVGGPEDKPRTIVTSDPELDDLNSMIRFLLYSNEVDTEGLIYTSSRFHWSGDGEGTLFFLPDREYTTPQTSWRWPEGPSHIERALDAYAEVYDNLKVHDPDYPHPDELRSVYRVGNVEFEGDISEETPGSQLIEEVLLDDEGGPVFLQAWGGTSTIARALKSIQEQYQDTPQWEEIYRKVSDKAIITRFGTQDETYVEYIAPNWPDIENREVATTTWGYFARRAVLPEDAHYLSAEWTRENVSEVGPLGELYRVWGDGRFLVEGDRFDFFGFDAEEVTVEELREQGYVVWTGALQPKGSWISEGDSSNFALLVDNGLRSYVDASYGGWGGRQVQSEDDPSLYVPATDTNEVGETPRDYATARWFDAIQRDFAARLQWSVTPDYDDANHAPVVTVPPGRLEVRAKPGQRVRLQSSISDPDGDEVTHVWWQYDDADTYPGEVVVADPAATSTTFTVPEDAEAGQTIHLILEATDDGSPAMTRYQRVVVTVTDPAADVVAYLDRIEEYVDEGRLHPRVAAQVRAGANRVAAWFEQGRLDAVAWELRRQTRTLEQNRHLVPDDEVWNYLVGEGTAILETMIATGDDG